MSNPTLFSEAVVIDDGFVTRAKLYQGKWSRAPYVSIEFFCHRVPQSIKELIIARFGKGWHYSEGPGFWSGYEVWLCYRTDRCSFEEEWQFAQSILIHQDRIQTPEQFSKVVVD